MFGRRTVRGKAGGRRAPQERKFLRLTHWGIFGRPAKRHSRRHSEISTRSRKKARRRKKTKVTWCILKKCSANVMLPLLPNNNYEQRKISSQNSRHRSRPCAAWDPRAGHLSEG